MIDFFVSGRKHKEKRLTTLSLFLSVRVRALRALCSRYMLAAARAARAARCTSLTVRAMASPPAPAGGGPPRYSLLTYKYVPDILEKVGKRRKEGNGERWKRWLWAF